MVYIMEISSSMAMVEILYNTSLHSSSSVVSHSELKKSLNRCILVTMLHMQYDNKGEENILSIRKTQKIMYIHARSRNVYASA